MAVAGAVPCFVITADCADRAIEAMTLGRDSFVVVITAGAGIDSVTCLCAGRFNNNLRVCMSEFVCVVIDITFTAGAGVGSVAGLRTSGRCDNSLVFMNEFAYGCDVCFFTAVETVM